MMAGVCGGLGDYFDIDPTLIRLLFVLGFFVTGSGLLWVYLMMLIVVLEAVPASQDEVRGVAQDVNEKQGA